MKWKVDNTYALTQYRDVSMLEEGKDKMGAVWWVKHDPTWICGCCNCDYEITGLESEEVAKALMVAHVRMDCEHTR